LIIWEILSKKKRKIMDKIPEDLGKNRKIIYPFTYI